MGYVSSITNQNPSKPETNKVYQLAIKASSFTDIDAIAPFHAIDQESAM